MARDPEPLLRIELNAHRGRTYHATCDIPAHSTVLAASTPYAYTIWKQFRNEVCAECWRYEGGRRTFLTRRDDEGVVSVTGSEGTSEKKQDKENGRPQESVGTGAGLWFCDEHCQATWLEREGQDTVRLLRTLEDARRKKEKGKAKENTSGEPVQTDVTQETIERAWEATRKDERILKEVKKWRNIQLDNFETDMARYVLLALIHLYRERYAQRRTYAQNDLASVTKLYSTNEVVTDRRYTVEFGGSNWDDFAALQSNELQHLRTYPELLENQIRIYQVLKGRFARAFATDQGSIGPTNNTFDDQRLVRDSDGGAAQHKDARTRIWQGEGAETWDLGSVITVENVRTALSVDPGNSFGIWEVPLTDESECLGFAVYPRPSFFNHHCLPNVSKERSGRALRFVTTRPVEPDEELCISYTHAEGMGWQARQKELKEGWFFDCRCSRCSAEMLGHSER